MVHISCVAIVIYFLRFVPCRIKSISLRCTGLIKTKLLAEIQCRSSRCLPYAMRWISSIASNNVKNKLSAKRNKMERKVDRHNRREMYSKTGDFLRRLAIHITNRESYWNHSSYSASREKSPTRETYRNNRLIIGRCPMDTVMDTFWAI